MNFRLALTVVGVLGVGAAGCKETIDSKNLRTAGIALTMTVTASSESSSTVKAVLRAGGDESNTYVDLSDGDALFATGGTETKEMGAESTGVYQTSFATGAADTPFKVDLQREDDDPAPNSSGTLPAPFSLTAFATSSFARDADVVVEWSPSGTSDDMRIEANGSCIFLYTHDIPGDTGSFTIPAGALDAPESSKDETCDIDLEITRNRSGSADPALDPESSVTLRHRRTSKFTSTPAAP
ncbi:MAG: hypothetical protein IT376_14060 [Polyangiaceae bacterium]|nr:hypothetical protein [Polyangiaceae bacterium]